MDEEYDKLDELWRKALGTINWSNGIRQLRTCFSCKAAWGIQSVPRTIDIAQFTGVYKGAAMEVLESIKQDWNSLLLIKKENGSRNPTVSEKYPEWRDRRVSDMVEISESVGTRRKRVSCEEELREQVK